MAAKDMTTGSPFKVIFFFTIPLLIGNVFQQLYSFTDTLIVGQTLGVKSLAAVGSTGAVVWLVLGFIQGITVGFSVVTGQRFGAGDMRGVKHSVAMCIYLCLFWTVLITTVSVAAAENILLFLNTPPDIHEEALTYLRIMYVGTGATIFYNMISNIIRAIGDSKTPLYFLIVAAVLNVILDLVLIKCFHAGVAGAAWATVIAQAVSGFLCLIFIYFKLPLLHIDAKALRFDMPFIMKHMRIGFPMGFQMAILTIGILTVQTVLNSFGSATIAAFTAAAKVEHMASQAIVTLGVSISTYSAQNYGAKNFKRIRTGIKKCIQLSFCFCLIGAACIFTYGETLVKMFISGDHPDIVHIAKTYLDIIIIFHFALGLLIIYRNCLQGMGYAVFPMWAGITELIMRVFVALVFGKLYGFVGVCFASPAAWIGAAVLLGVGYYRTIKKATYKTHKTVRLNIENILGMTTNHDMG